jgi:hypothetical protein
MIVGINGSVRPEGCPIWRTAQKESCALIGRTFLVQLAHILAYDKDTESWHYKELFEG